jgi:hypothetical protein
MLNQERLAAIEYHGTAGTTSTCLAAIIRLLHAGDNIIHAKLVSCSHKHGRDHGFILTVNHGEQIAIKSGFTSGYSGEGPRGLAMALWILDEHKVEIDEYEVRKVFIERLDQSCLLRSDLERLEKATPLRPERWYDYIMKHSGFRSIEDLDDKIKLNAKFPVAIPFHIIDGRIMDLALSFSQDADNAILSAFRRLEDLIKDRTKAVDKSGARLFSAVFQGEHSLLHWNDRDPGEHAAKAKMFDAIFGAYRNPRAHGECRSGPGKKLREFLLVNELFLLEQSAIERPLEAVSKVQSN